MGAVEFPLHNIIAIHQMYAMNTTKVTSMIATKVETC